MRLYLHCLPKNNNIPAWGKFFDPDNGNDKYKKGGEAQYTVPQKLFVKDLPAVENLCKQIATQNHKQGNPYGLPLKLRMEK